MSQPSFAIVIPIHNEAGFLLPALGTMTAQVDLVSPDYQVILAENGSTDETAAEASEAAEHDPRITVIRLPEADYGLAMRRGLEHAQDADWLITFDIDYYSGPFIRQTLALNESADLVIASKRAPGSDDRRPLIRRLGTRVFNFILRKATGSKVSDTHGIKAFRRTMLEKLLPDVHLTEDLFDTEVVVRAEREQYRIAEVPIVVEELREARSSLIRRIPRTLRGVARLRQALRDG